ncbi:MAG: glycosyltransferase [Candidatus Paceibacterota bacterium]|jgi:glycosyltransferase involved in cell wall biosynthesis
MKVLFIGTTDILGGAAKVSWELKSYLEAHGHETAMFVADKRSDDRKVRIIPRQTWRKYLGLLLATESLISTDWILDTPEFKGADVIHCHNLHGRFFNLKTLERMSALKPVVWTLHDEWALTPHCAYTLEGTGMKNGLYVCPSIDVAPRILWDNSRRLAAWKNGIYEKIRVTLVTPSRWLEDRTRKTTLGTQDIRLIANGIDTSRFVQSDKGGARAKLGLPLDKKIILFLAVDAKANTWKGWKHTERIIESYRDRSDILFLSVGNLTQHESRGNVRHTGHVSDVETLALYYSSADALLFTSIAENFPLVILEAMSCGLPIAAFDVGGVKEALEHKINGFVAPYEDTTALSKGLEWILSLTESEQKTLSNASTQKARTRYDISHMTDAYMSLYQELIAKNQ